MDSILVTKKNAARVLGMRPTPPSDLWEQMAKVEGAIAQPQPVRLAPFVHYEQRKLTPRQSQAVLLYADGLSAAEIAERLGTTSNRVYGLLRYRQSQAPTPRLARVKAIRAEKQVRG